MQDGLYVLQSVLVYGSTCPGPAYFTGRAVWLVCGSDWITANDFLDPGEDASAPYPVRRWDLVQATSGSTLTGQIACSPNGSSGTAKWDYSATPGHFSLMYPNGSVYEVDNFVLQ